MFWRSARIPSPSRSGLWLQLISDTNPIDESIHRGLEDLISETKELVKIFASIIRKKSTKPPLP